MMLAQVELQIKVVFNFGHCFGAEVQRTHVKFLKEAVT
jgi:hypothetical protein